MVLEGGGAGAHSVHDADDSADAADDEALEDQGRLGDPPGDVGRLESRDDTGYQAQEDEAAQHAQKVRGLGRTLSRGLVEASDPGQLRTIKVLRGGLVGEVRAAAVSRIAAGFPDGRFHKTEKTSDEREQELHANAALGLPEGLPDLGGEQVALGQQLRDPGGSAGNGDVGEMQPLACQDRTGRDVPAEVVVERGAVVALEAGEAGLEIVGGVAKGAEGVAFGQGMERHFLCDGCRCHREECTRRLWFGKRAFGLFLSGRLAKGFAAVTWVSGRGGPSLRSG